ncbi:MAG: tetratricopeptide repeat protein [Chloroflexi bacterium]|nr:tetratricopeptide repeat protein [Chloroflexota bacterium]
MDTEKAKFQQAIDLVRQGQRQQARSLLQEIIEQNQDDDQVWLWLAVCYTTDEARLSILQFALKRHPGSEKLKKALDLQIERMEEANAPLDPIRAETTAMEIKQPEEPVLPTPVLPELSDDGTMTQHAAQIADVQMEGTVKEAEDVLQTSTQAEAQLQEPPVSIEQTKNVPPVQETPAPVVGVGQIRKPAAIWKDVRPVFITVVLVLIIILMAYLWTIYR